MSWTKTGENRPDHSFDFLLEKIMQDYSEGHENTMNELREAVIAVPSIATRKPVYGFEGDNYRIAELYETAASVAGIRPLDSKELQKYLQREFGEDTGPAAEGGKNGPPAQAEGGKSGPPKPAEGGKKRLPGPTEESRGPWLYDADSEVGRRINAILDGDVEGAPGKKGWRYWPTFRQARIGLGVTTALVLTHKGFQEMLGEWVGSWDTRPRALAVAGFAVMNIADPTFYIDTALNPFIGYPLGNENRETAPCQAALDSCHHGNVLASSA